MTVINKITVKIACIAKTVPETDGPSLRFPPLYLECAESSSPSANTIYFIIVFFSVSL